MSPAKTEILKAERLYANQDSLFGSEGTYIYMQVWAALHIQIQLSGPKNGPQTRKERETKNSTCNMKYVQDYRQESKDVLFRPKCPC